MSDNDPTEITGTAVESGPDADPTPALSAPPRDDDRSADLGSAEHADQNGDADQADESLTTPQQPETPSSEPTDQEPGEPQEQPQQPDPAAEVQQWEQRYKDLQRQFTQDRQVLKAYQPLGEPDQLKQELESYREYQERTQLKPWHPQSTEHGSFQRAYANTIAAEKSLQILQQRDPSWNERSPEEQQALRQQVYREHGVTEQDHQMLVDWNNGLQQETQAFQQMGPSAYVRDVIQQDMPNIRQELLSQVFAVLNAERNVDQFVQQNADLIKDPEFQRFYSETGNSTLAAEFAAAKRQAAQGQQEQGSQIERQAGEKARRAAEAVDAPQRTAAGERPHGKSSWMQKAVKGNLDENELLESIFSNP